MRHSPSALGSGRRVDAVPGTFNDASDHHVGRELQRLAKIVVDQKHGVRRRHSHIARSLRSGRCETLDRAGFHECAAPTAGTKLDPPAKTSRGDS